MDDSSLSSRSAAMDALSALSASHARLFDLASSLVDRLFPGDGTLRDEEILPFANLAFIAVGKAKNDLDTYSKSFEGVLKTIDTIRPPPPASQAPAVVVSEMSGQSESVGALKRKYEEGMAAAPPASPKKSPAPSAQKRSFVPGKATAAAPLAHVKQSHASPATSEVAPPQQAREEPQAPPKQEEAPPAVAAQPLTATVNSADLEIQPVNPNDDDFASPFDLPTVAGVPPSPRRPPTTTAAPAPASHDSELSSSDPVSSSSSSRPAGKDAMKKVLENMVLPQRKKMTASVSPPSPKRDGNESPFESVPSNAAATTTAPTTSTSETPEQSNESGKAANQGTAGTTSDDDISSDEEEYLRGVEERRQRAAAEKEERLKAAKEAREARQTMYAFLTEEPPPGFISVKPTATTSSSGKKSKKEKKDKARDKHASGKGLVPEDVSGEKKALGSHHTSPQGTPKRASGMGPSTPTNGMAQTGSDLDLSSSMTASNSNTNLTNNPHQPPVRTASGSLNIQGDSWTTRYRPTSMVDPLSWQRAEEAIMNDPPPTKKRWEEYQAKYNAKVDAAAAAENKKLSGTLSRSRGLSSKNVRKGSSPSLALSRDSSSNLRDSSSAIAPESPRRKSNAEDGNTSPRRSTEDGSGDADGETANPRPRPVLRHTDSTSKKPLPKLESVDDARTFLFEAPVTEANLRFMERNGEEVLAGGTIEKLIQHLTSAAEPSPEYFQCFMLTYHNFLTPQELIELLRLRWNSQPSEPSKLEVFISKHLFPIRLRIVNVLRMWIETFGSDFKDEAAVAALQSFIDYIRQEYPQMADLVSSKLKKYLAGHIYDGEAEIDEDPPVTHPIQEGKEFNPSLTDIHPEEFARQMTLVEHALFKAIPYKELLTNGKAGKTNPNVANMISYTNHLVNWIGTQILKHIDIRLRATALARFITIAKFCILSCQNYNGAMEILSALRSSTVFRLKHTWNMLPDTIWDDYEWLEDLFESDNNYARYRKALNNAVPPCVPYLGRYLSEMVFLNEIHPDYLSQGPPPIINFTKMMLVADIMHHMQRYQKSPFCLTGVPIIQKSFLLKRGVMNEKELYKISLEREPKDAPSSPMVTH